jgi:prepilin-type N-terminal cleavage/methylation domain-containing protein
VAKTITNQRGFTLLEILLVVGILSVFLSILYQFLFFNTQFVNETNDDHDTYLHARIAMSRTLNLLQQYQELEIPAGQSAVIGKGIKNITTGEIENVSLINFAKNTDKLTGYKYYYYCPETGHSSNICQDNAHVGQILNEAGEVVVDGIKEFSFAYDNPTALQYINVNVLVVSTTRPNDLGLRLSTKLRVSRSLIEG